MKNNTIIAIKNLEHLSGAAKEFVKLVGDNTLFAFYGDMGVGKTTFIKAICRELGVEDVINSPTFAIINEYQSTTNEKVIYHFDFYRINKTSEAVDLGVDDYFYSGNFCFMEWPEKIEELLPLNTTHVIIKENADGSRIITID